MPFLWQVDRRVNSICLSFPIQFFSLPLLLRHWAFELESFGQPDKTADISQFNHWFPMKWRLRNKRRSSINADDVRNPYLGSDFDWLKQISLMAQTSRSITQIWVMTHHYGISALAQISFHRETRGGVTKCTPFSQAKCWRTCPESSQVCQ